MALAQEAPHVVPFTDIPPFMQRGPQGDRSGFVVEPSEMIGAEIGVPINNLEVDGSRGFVGAQASGDAHMIAGISQLPALRATNVFSNPVALDVLLPAIQAERKDSLPTASCGDSGLAPCRPQQGRMIWAQS